MDNKILIEYVQLLLEKKIKEAQLSGGRTALWGSEEHIADLENRWREMCSWRDKYPKGTENRANYSRLANRLKAEMKSAKKYHEKSKLVEKNIKE